MAAFMPFLLRAAAIVAGLLGGTGAGLLFARGDAVAGVTAIAGALFLGALVWRTVPQVDRPAVAGVIAVAYGGRLALLALLHEFLVALGRGGHLIGDEYQYADLSWRLAQWLHGIPAVVGWFGERYLFGNFVYVETGIFYVFGPQVTIVKVLNALFACLLCLVVFALARRFFTRRAAYAALAMTAFSPTLVLWSVLNLKEAPVLLLAGVVLLAVVRFSAGVSSWPALVGAYVALVALQSVREWLFLLLAGLVPLAIALAPRPVLPRRLRYTAATLLASAVLMASSSGGFLGLAWLAPDRLEFIEKQRFLAAEGARTALTAAEKPPATAAAPPPLRSTTLSGATPSPTHSTAPSPSETSGMTAAATPTQAPAVAGQPVGGGAAGSTNAQEAPTSEAPAPSTRANDQVSRSVQAAGRLLSYLPRGFLYAVAAPFLWAAQTAADRATIPAMLAWYIIAVAAVVGTWRARRDWRRLAPILGYLTGVFVVLSLAEGNAGTLFRHRSVAEPFVALLASPLVAATFGGLPVVWGRIFRRREAATAATPSRPPRRLSVIVPVYNERDNIAEVMRRVLAVELPAQMSREVIVVDDGSTDGTSEILKEFEKLPEVRVLRFERNRGKGAACRTGLEYVTGDVVVIQDADFEYDPKLYPRLLAPMVDQGAFVVFGSRFRGSVRGMRLPNRIANVVLRILANLLYRANITDEATGFKVFRVEALNAISLSADRFDLCSEVTAKVCKAGFKIYEVPIDYVARTRAEGKKIRWQDGVVAIWTLLKYRI